MKQQNFRLNYFHPLKINEFVLIKNEKKIGEITNSP